ncbi:hypothetical protein EGW08_002173 [Elysia chlorotica]|uniref:Uncharacterized protein n=1 Tax=Elysia chlorotica TaxID=188477 RepID=A0A3S1BVX3_ELYCH|nr:hypothetical protein EGW08_002173 [Elysia chlorotica]
MLYLLGPTYMLAVMLFLYEGIVAFSFYQSKGCDPLASKQITSSSQLVPLLVKNILGSVPAMPGLFLAALFSASLSNYVAWEEKSELITMNIPTVVVLGVIACSFSFMAAELGGTLLQGAFAGGVVSFALGLWLSLGSSFSPDVPRPVMLQFASTDRCVAGWTNSSILINTTYAAAMNVSDMTAPTTAAYPSPLDEVSTLAPVSSGP